MRRLLAVAAAFALAGCASAPGTADYDAATRFEKAILCAERGGHLDRTDHCIVP